MGTYQPSASPLRRLRALLLDPERQLDKRLLVGVEQVEALSVGVANPSAGPCGIGFMA